MVNSPIPYRRTYSRILIALAIVSVFLHAAIPDNQVGSLVFLRAFVGTFGIAIGAIWSPVLIYAGFRTRCSIDLATGCAGTLTLLYWFPCVLLR